MNRHAPRMLTLAVALLALAAGPVLAQEPGCAEKGAAGYDAEREIRIQGRVQSVERAECPCGMKGMHVTLKSGEGTYKVALGPATFVDQKKFSLAKGDEVSLTGSEGTCHGEKVLRARVITRGDATLTLRDEEGLPLWSRRAQR